RQGLCRLHAVTVGVVTIPVVQEEDRSVVHPLERALRDDLGAGPRRVPDAERPSDRALAERRGDRRDERIAESMWRAEEARSHTRGAYDLLGSACQIVANVGCRAAVQLAMKVPVVPELMPFLHHAADDLGPTLGMSSEHEERRAHPLTPEHVEDGGRGVWVGAVIEGDADRVLALRQVC